MAHRRARWIMVFFAICLSICALRLFQLQIVQASTLAAQGQQVRTSQSELPAKRGAILDSSGLVLADSVQTYHIAVNQTQITQYEHWESVKDSDGTEKEVLVRRGPAAAAEQLAPLLDMDPVQLGGLMVGDSTYRYLKKNVDAVTYRKIRALDIYGIEWESQFDREYPDGNTAAPVIGTVNAEGVGSSGLESTMNKLLTGTPGAEAYEIAPNGAIMPGGKQTVTQPVDGASVTTTLHADLQHSVQQILDARVKKHMADWGAVVIQDVSTGKVLVMADSGSTTPDSSKPQTVGAVQYAYEPGSVGKIVTMATGLEKGAFTPTTEVTVPYSIEPPDAGGPITDFHEHPDQLMTATGILAESSNVGTVLLGEKVSDQDRYEMMKKLGLGSQTGIELAGESAGLVRDPSLWVGRDHYVSMFGQSWMMTALQESSIMATIGNGGVRMDPRLVECWTAANGTVHTPDPVVPVQAMSSDTASALVKMMQSTVYDKSGTAQLAAVPGYNLAVKTGTAEIVVDGKSGTVSTVAGLIPAESPKLAISIVLYNPKVGFISSESAAPLFSEVTAQAARSLAIPASTQAPELYPVGPED